MSGLLNVRVSMANKKGQMKPGKKWKNAYFLLLGGSLHYYAKKEVIVVMRCSSIC